MADQTAATAAAGGAFPLPRVTIKFCTQCKWMLRAAYYAQELLSTFSTALGEVALQPSTGGTFVVEILHAPQATPSSTSTTATNIQPRVLWDRKTDGGFPETKELKRRVRDVIEPGRDLGHVDRDHRRPAAAAPASGPDDTTTAASASALPSRAELEAAGQAGGGGPGEAEAAARLLGGLGKAEEADKPCEDCA